MSIADVPFDAGTETGMQQWLLALEMVANGTPRGTMVLPQFGLVDDLELMTMELFHTGQREQEGDVQ